MASNITGSIAVALTGSTATAARDIPQLNLRNDNDELAAAAKLAHSLPAHHAKHSASLLTPPHSISPSLPPHSLKARDSAAVAPAAGLDPIESDVDLQDALSPTSQSPGLESTGAITCSLLAKHHLPEILLNHGPLAIRHVMGYLTTSVPGFSGIPPAKARRLVVGALEGRGGHGELGGINGDVKFEKVGWGRWDARLKGQPAKNSRGIQYSPPPSESSSYTAGLPIPGCAGWMDARTRTNLHESSWAGDSAVFSHDDDMLENEADKMSLDGDCSSSEAPPEDEIMGDDPDDITDDEDWAAVGAAALRQPSYSGSGPARNFLSSHVYTGGSYSGGPSSFALAKSAPMVHLPPRQAHIDFSALGVGKDAQERDAIEALLRMGSV